MTAQPKKKELMTPSHSISLPVTGHLTDTGLALPDGLDVETWIKAGMEIARLRGATQWWIGDWWIYGDDPERKWAYGERKEIVEGDDWDGPSLETCSKAGVVCRAVETFRRRNALSFMHHAEIATLPVEWQDKLLDEAEADSRPAKWLRHRVKEVRAFLSQGWTPDQMARQERVQNGETVVATMREIEGVGIDRALIAWAEANDLAVRIDRKGPWGNPFELDEDGDRNTVVENFRWYLDRKPSLQKELQTLRGKVLMCWCHPERCHGDILCEVMEG